MTWQRARSPEKKEQRRAAILDAARTMLDENGLAGAGLNALAREAGMSKGNIYQYFESREAVFLQIVIEELTEWADDTGQALAAVVVGDRDQISDALVTSLAKRPRLLQLVPLIAQVFERNVSADTVVAFTSSIGAVRAKVGDALSVVLPDLSRAEIRLLLDGLFYLLGGMAPNTNPSPACVEALSRPEMAGHAFQLDRELGALLRVLIRGLRA
jgi:TetR/AcrR family transcriptional regulator